MTDDATQPLIGHLVELRTRLLRCIICILIVLACLLYFSNDIYHIVANPLIRQLPTGSSMIATDIAAPFFTPIKLTAVVAIFVSIPYVLYQVWGFIAPALYQHEKRLVMPLIISSTILFYIGIAFAYFMVFPLAFYFFIHTAPVDVAINTDITKYLDFVMTLFIVFGFAFEVPVAIILLCWTGVTNPQSLRKKRPYIIVGVFAVAMFVTPPDVFSQILLAIPICLLFEIGTFFARFYQPRKNSQLDNESQQDLNENQ
ncbi:MULTISPECIES: twin-arginine translocase subunit TatC [unclassified Gilliamella]|uniref:twin-arginine translocase subunit TatC n=1 Tax=unclassified Gilliamella TaxID=2685620 RepID=UPI00226AE13E|nr:MULTISPECIES: twin-arginine translocase subunit TatC [unclassified Gilliamella]MCX8601167.1 twin-arginine translocase subunit TatC [Gilliamella sp. B3722]MCX8607321.1 twin-arginine translocase subunit TatC [Gilliamella sp. B3771]MCX8610490.1 twin-arginine translocase subunit TatC [Gilliamella sp. B3891]MCX8612841.1 twin-arginine translocase subunit TatC [Gilliamella sp. B3773]MCX8614750.1 twin-arginine translocase subunit TatC [Gilliamella sp. B3770]